MHFTHLILPLFVIIHDERAFDCPNEAITVNEVLEAKNVKYV
jgi:hypothetical protein